MVGQIGDYTTAGSCEVFILLNNLFFASWFM